MFLGWYDPDRKKPARQKVAEAIERYVEKFGAKPEVVLTSESDAAELLAPVKKTRKTRQPRTPGLALPVRSVAYIPRWTYYVGIEERPEQVEAA